MKHESESGRCRSQCLKLVPYGPPIVPINQGQQHHQNHHMQENHFGRFKSMGGVFNFEAFIFETHHFTKNSGAELSQKSGATKPPNWHVEHDNSPGPRGFSASLPGFASFPRCFAKAFRLKNVPKNMSWEKLYTPLFKRPSRGPININPFKKRKDIVPLLTTSDTSASLASVSIFNFTSSGTAAPSGACTWHDINRSTVSKQPNPKQPILGNRITFRHVLMVRGPATTRFCHRPWKETATVTNGYTSRRQKHSESSTSMEFKIPIVVLSNCNPAILLLIAAHPDLRLRVLLVVLPPVLLDPLLFCLSFDAAMFAIASCAAFTIWWFLHRGWSYSASSMSLNFLAKAMNISSASMMLLSLIDVKKALTSCTNRFCMFLSLMFSQEDTHLEM